jgi:hypothetical protein
MIILQNNKTLSSFEVRIQMMAPSGGGSAERVAPPDGRGGWALPTSPQATTPAASFKTFMDDVTAVLHMIDKLPLDGV